MLKENKYGAEFKLPSLFVPQSYEMPAAGVSSRCYKNSMYFH